MVQRAVLSLAVLILAAGCARSKVYEARESIDEEGSSYYASPAAKQSPTDRIQAMGQPKKRVIVFNFWNDTPVRDIEIGAFGADELRRGLFLTQRMILPTEIRMQLETKDYVEGDRVKVAQLVQEGRRLGVSAVVIGRITKIIFRQRGDEVGLFRQKQSLAAVDVEIKIFDVQAGREISASSRSGESSSNSLVALESENLESAQYRSELTRMALRDAMNRLTPDIVRSIEKMSWEGKIAKIIGTKVYLNSGRASGLIGGDILRVLTPSDDVYDPDSGAFLGRTRGQLKGTLEVIDFLGDDAAVATIHTGGQFAEGDSVRLY